MNIVFMTGSHPRHAFVAEAVARSGLLRGLVIEEREDHMPEPPKGLAPATESLFRRHFADRAASEAKFFRSVNTPSGVNSLKVSLDDLNGPKTWAFLDQQKPDLVLSYGVHKLTPETLGHACGLRWNIHGGLSPWYRGVVTHFWPSYFLEPQMTGMTLHETTEAIDGGAIVHQTAADLVRGDGIHDLACRAVAGLALHLPELLQRAAIGHTSPPVVQKTSGRIWRSVDWRPEHLHPVYELYGNKIVDFALDGKFECHPPKLIQQF
jgi:hypothetical protein